MLLKTLHYSLILIVLNTALALNECQAALPEDYQKLEACEKQDILWKQVEESKYDKLPKFKTFGLVRLIKMSFQKIIKKAERLSDEAPKKWTKYLHRHGAVAKVKIVPTAENVYSGVFKGAECALIRLSLTYKPKKKKPVAPGLALKVFRKGNPSANISALYSISGQGRDFNFFANPLSNIVPTGDAFGEGLVHKIFKKVTDYPEELLVDHFAEVDAQGLKEEKIVTPRQIFFVPNTEIKFSSDSHDVRKDFLKIPEGTKLYTIYAMPQEFASYDYSKYKIKMIKEFAKKGTPIANIYTTSEFIASEYGDDRIFFRHQIRKKY